MLKLHWFCLTTVEIEIEWGCCLKVTQTGPGSFSREVPARWCLNIAVSSAWYEKRCSVCCRNPKYGVKWNVWFQSWTKPGQPSHTALAFWALVSSFATRGNYCDSVSFTYCHEDQMQNRLKHLASYKVLSTLKLHTSTGNTFLMVGREASELRERKT